MSRVDKLGMLQLNNPTEFCKDIDYRQIANKLYFSLNKTSFIYQTVFRLHKSSLEFYKFF